MKVWCLFDYRELDAIYSTHERAQTALTEAIGPNPLKMLDGRLFTGYHIEEWTVDA